MTAPWIQLCNNACRLVESNNAAIKTLKEKGVAFHQIDIAALQKLYQEAAAQKGFSFDPQWQAAYEEIIAANPGK